MIPINPHEKMIEGHPVYASVLDVPGPIDMATVYVQPEAGVRVMEDLAAKKVAEIWLNPGADGPAGRRTRQQAGAEDDSGVQHHRA